MTVTLDPAEEGATGTTTATTTSQEACGEEAMVVVHREPDSTTLPPASTTVAPPTTNSNVTAAQSSSVDNAMASLDPHGWLGLSSTAASALLGAEGGVRGAEGGIREQIHNRQNARDRTAKAAEGNCEKICS